MQEILNKCPISENKSESFVWHSNEGRKGEMEEKGKDRKEEGKEDGKRRKGKEKKE